MFLPIANRGNLDEMLHYMRHFILVSTVCQSIHLGASGPQSVNGKNTYLYPWHLCILGEYKEMVGDFLPFKKLGYPTLEDFIQSVPDVVELRW